MITLNDILDIAQYEKQRPEFRAHDRGEEAPAHSRRTGHDLRL